jgi:hypothetical protein
LSANHAWRCRPPSAARRTKLTLRNGGEALRMACLALDRGVSFAAVMSAQATPTLVGASSRRARPMAYRWTHRRRPRSTAAARGGAASMPAPRSRPRGPRNCTSLRSRVRRPRGRDFRHHALPQSLRRHPWTLSGTGS